MGARPLVAVVGSNDETARKNAKALGRLIADENWGVVCGGRNSGVMAAVCEGARQIRNGLTIGVLPDTSEASPDVDVVIRTGLGNARNNVIALTGCVMVACGVDGPGTASEVALALKSRKRVILLGASRAATAFYKSLAPGLVDAVATPAAAVGLIKEKGWC